MLLDIQGQEAIEDGIVNDLNAITFQEGVSDIPLATTRAALYIYLNAMVGYFLSPCYQAHNFSSLDGPLQTTLRSLLS